jgi:hypothetical protein
MAASLQQAPDAPVIEKTLANPSTFQILSMNCRQWRRSRSAAGDVGDSIRGPVWSRLEESPWIFH